MFLEKLIEQHGVHLVVANTEGPAIFVQGHQVLIHVSDLLGDQTKLRAALTVVLVMEGHWLEREDCFARFVHWLNVVLEASRRGQGADLPMDINGHGEVVRIKGFLEDVSDVATIGHINARNTDANGVTGIDDIRTCIGAQGDVIAAGSVVSERANTDSRVAVTSLVVLEYR